MQGQVVNAGAMLFDIEALDRVWVRVPVYVGDRRVLDLEAEARVGDLTEAPGRPTRPARPMNDAPPSGDPLAATVHLFYEVSNDDHAFWPGQRVGVTVPLPRAGRGPRRPLAPPCSTTITAAPGSTRRSAPRTYARRRVRLDRIAGDVAVLLDGP